MRGMAKLKDVANDVQIALQTVTRAEETLGRIFIKDVEKKNKVLHELKVLRFRLTKLREELKEL